jgi:hypothetical protein
LTAIGLLAQEKRKKIFSKTNTCKNGFSYSGPVRSPGTMIRRNFNFCYVRKLSCSVNLSFSGHVILEKMNLK